MRSFATTALCLSLIHTSSARVPYSSRNRIQRDAETEAQPAEGFLSWLSRLLRRGEIKSRQEGSYCVEDSYYDFVGSDQLGAPFCQDFLNLPNQTIPVQATATR